MKTFIGTKVLEARPMARGEYNAYRGWTPPEGEAQNVDGMLVRYSDGYESWTPLPQFTEAYRPLDAMTFGDAVHMLKLEKRVARAGWNGKGMWLMLVERSTLGVHALRPWVAMKTVDDEFVPWLANQTDVLAEDWQVVE